MLIYSILFLGCTEKTTTGPNLEPSFIEVKIIEGDLGSEDAPLPFSPEPITRQISLQTLDSNADPYPMDGDLRLSLRPGQLGDNFDAWVDVEDGTWTGNIDFKVAFGPTRIWATDSGDKDISTGRIPTYATGLSETMHFHIPTIAEFNDIEDTETNHLVGEFTEVRVEDRDVLVTFVGTNGFWITDMTDGVGNHSSMYVYTFQKPEHVLAGNRLTKLNGGNQEYLGTTQFSFPSYEAEESDIGLPEPAVLDEDQLCNDATMEGYESAIVTVQNASIPASFTAESEEYLDYLEYGQWPVEIGDCSFFVDSSALTYAFDPLDEAGNSFSEIKGVVVQIWTKWIIVMLDDDGVTVNPAAFPARPTVSGPRLPRARSRQ